MGYYFTKYITPVGTPYGVTGVLNNVGIKVADAENIPSPSTYTNYNAHNFYQEINTVGYDWKTFDMSSFSYILDNDRCFFIKKIITKMFGELSLLNLKGPQLET